MKIELGTIGLVFALCLCACADDQAENNANNANNANNLNNVNNANNTNNSNSTNGGSCVDVQNRMVDAIRAMPRDCVTAADCEVVVRAGQCECANSVSVGSDVAAFQSVLQDLIDDGCTHPFACSDPRCSYDTGSAYEPKEIITTCEEGTCGLIEVMQCTSYADRVHGGLVPTGNCLTDLDCELRDDLNPCGCDEGASINFPLLTAYGVYDMMEANRDRCTFACDECPAVTTAVCIETEGGDSRACSAQ